MDRFRLSGIGAAHRIRPSGRIFGAEELIAHVISHGYVRIAEEQPAEEVIADVRVSAQPQRCGAVLAAEASAVEELALGAHTFH